ncbi:MAG: hypothetical protein EP338_01765 [Bacteroidetes bacterium]|nr:MAG: hypothetical protein EP338_01765 [Bacteroidota bacterium]
MVQFWLILAVLMIVFTFVLYLLSINYFRKENSEQMWKHFGMRTRYWQGLVMVSFGMSFFALLILKWTNLVHF